MADPFSPLANIAAFHGFLGLLFLLLYSGSVIDLLSLTKDRVKRLRYIAAGMAIAVWITSFSGLFLYMFYRDPSPLSPRSIIKASQFPYLHTVFFELKEHIGMFPPVIMLLAAFIIWRYGDMLVSDKKMKFAVLALITLGFLWVLATFGLGVIVTKFAPL